MATTSRLKPPRPARSDHSDNYYDGRANYPYAHASRGRSWAHDHLQDLAWENDMSQGVDATKANKIPPHYDPTPHRQGPPAATPLNGFQSVGIDHRAEGVDHAEQTHRIARWVETQQAEVYVTLPLESFEAMVDQLDAMEDALETLKSAAFSCLNRAQPLWKRPEDARHERAMYEDDKNDATRAEIFRPSSDTVARPNVAALGPDLPAFRSNDHSVPSRVPYPYHTVSQSPQHEGYRPMQGAACAWSESESDLSRFVEKQEASTPPSKVSKGEVHSRAAKQTSDATSRAVTLPTSWLDDSSSQSSYEAQAPEGSMKPEIRFVTSSPDAARGGKDDEQNSFMAGREKQVRGTAASLHSTPGSGHDVLPSTTTLAGSKKRTASRIEARLRNRMDRFLLKMRPSRSSLAQDSPTSRSPLTLSPEELDAYLALPSDAVASAGPPKMTPRPPTGDRNRRILTSRHSAPLLRGK